MEDTTHTPPPRKRFTPPSRQAVMAAVGAAAMLRAAAAREAEADPDQPRHLLIDARLEGNRLEVLMPQGELWLFTMGDINAAPIPVLAVIDRADPCLAVVHRPGVEGLHPFIGTGRRYGVERGAR